MLRVRLLGELEVEVDGRIVAPPASRRAWSLLGWLALHPGEHPRTSVAARFWPDVLDSSARASLRSAAWSLRRALGPCGEAALIAGRDRIGLRCETDIAQFDAHCAAGRLEDATALCRGPLLADLDDDWVLEARDEHAARLSSTLARLAASAASPQEAIGWARRRLALDVLDEQAARDLMIRLAAGGDRAGALQAYDRLAERLRTTLGLAPSAETRGLAAELRAGEREADGPGAGGSRAAVAESPARARARRGAAAGADPAGPPLVDRQVEMGELLGLWDGVRSGAGGLAILTGEGGIGKTRLAAELSARARAAGAQIARCTAVDLGGAPPFGPWVELLAELARDVEPPPPQASWPDELARLAPSLPARLGRAARPADDIPPDLARARLFEAAVELVEHAAATRPLVLTFDDAHLADGPTLELIAYVARRIARTRVLLVLTRRMAPRRDTVDALVQAARGRGVALAELDLQPLPREAVERLVGEVAALDTLQRDHVVSVADGNPLLALESARATARGDQGPPPSLRAAVRGAIARLSDDARRGAELAAVAGRDLDRSELATLVAPQAVLEAADTGLFRGAGGRFGFRHALLREAAYADIDEARRALLHEQLGEALAARPAEAARHLRLAGRADLAARRLVQAAAEALRATAVHEAAAYLREAAELRPRDPEPRLELGSTLALLGRSGEAEAALEAALAVMDPEDGRRRAAAHLRAARWYRSSLCNPSAAGVTAQRGLEALGAEPAPELRAELLLLRAWAEITTGVGDAGATLRRMEALGAEATFLVRHDLETVRGFVALAAGRLEEAERILASSGENAERAGRVDMAYGGWANAACIAAAAGDHERALRYADRARASTLALPVVRFQVAGMRAYLLARLDRQAEARAELDEQAAIAERLGSPELIASADHDAGMIALLDGDHERAERLLARALTAGAPVQRAEARLRRAEALARLGRPDEADAEIRAAALEPVRAAHRPAVLVARMAFAQALSARARGDRETAERRFGEAAAQWRRLAADVSGEHLASLVDLGRPPVTGVVDPARELERVADELREPTVVPT